MPSPVERTRRQAAIAIILFATGGVITRRSMGIGLALIVCGFALTFLSLWERRRRS